LQQAAAENQQRERFHADTMRLGRDKLSSDLKPKPADPIKGAADLRSELQGLGTYKNTALIAESFRRAQSASGTAAGDMALIYGYMKLLDPGSAVKEGEYASAKNAAGVPDKIRVMFNNAQAGEILSQKTRDEFKGEAKRLLGAQADHYDKFAEPYRRMATERGYNPNDVVLDFGLRGMLSDPAPSPGASPSAPKRPTRTVGSETREWNGSAWVAPGTP
jgi:hypothetical protein